MKSFWITALQMESLLNFPIFTDSCSISFLGVSLKTGSETSVKVSFLNTLAQMTAISSCRTYSDTEGSDGGGGGLGIEVDIVEAGSGGGGGTDDVRVDAVCSGGGGETVVVGEDDVAVL